ncbi:ABC transporter ATP-binding protein [Epibacterium sp. MM17-32]|uniref:ABC transporter ATP-binding protein n=1 Tax=Epibacterium sp. MM17-32 TaxID=2917734 RepID=UPI001EF576DF|nr:ABC transporter ATP-binding protein [Epibacterium sp. MM17-32]MCG7630240.1 ABC transporter ATP-binding protein [Epibacterium sp. MM17-32]
MTNTHLKLAGLAKSYGSFIAVEEFSLDIAQGEFIAIMGPSGCGKTTSLRMLAGLETADRGEITLAGNRIDQLPVWERETPMVWQSLALFPFMTVRENVEFGLKMRGVTGPERRRRADDWLNRLGISTYADRNVARLSGGQRQRVALARSLVLEPKVLLLDEPLSALDAHMAIKMQGELKKLQRELGITFVYVTHSHSEAFSLADRVVIMNAGRVEQIGSPQDIFLRPRSKFVAQFVGGISLLEGKVSGSEGSKRFLDTRDGKVRLANSGGLAEGARADLAVRADRISVTVEPGWGENEIACTLVSEEFAGAVVNLHLETASGRSLVAQLQQRDLEQLDASIGARVYASWHSDDGFILESAQQSAAGARVRAA